MTEEVLDAELREEDLANPENVEPANVEDGNCNILKAGLNSCKFKPYIM